jgi:uncharacterized membrane protein YebE (DUF533 family)
MLTQVPLDINHIQVIVQALYDLAKTDGVHDAEKVMIQGFYQSCQADAQALTSFDQLLNADFNPSTAFTYFETEDQKNALLNSCILLAYADGHYSQGEKDRIRIFAKALGVSADQLSMLEESVADHLLQKVSRIQNLEALKAVSKEM